MKKRGQIWIEVVIYTLIALSLIGAVLAFITPKIGEIQDKAIIEQSITMMQNIDTVISSVAIGGPGNKRIIDLGIKKGALTIDAQKDEFVFEMESEYEYSQLGEEINIGDIIALTEEIGSLNKITLKMNYSEYDLTYNGKNETKLITKASTPYKLSIENKGGTKTIIEIIVS
jgi:type II secretory pathway pseudopilin PulG|tara:strand:- start:21 stop:536 length:516 start_codon:yes stop_codon:yes gene_type:complete